MLQKLPLRIDLTNGIDQKHDELLVLPTKLALAQNALFGEQGTLETRPGFDGASTSSVAVQRLAAYKKTAVYERSDGLFTSGGQRILPSTSSAYTDFARCDAVVTPLLGSAELTGPYNFDCARGASTSCWISETINSGGGFGVLGIIIDETTGNETARFLLSDTTATNRYFSPRIVPSATAGEFHLYYVKSTGGTEFVQHRTVSAAGVLGSETAVGSQVALSTSGALYDVAPDVLSHPTSCITIALKRSTGLIEIRSVSATDGVTLNVSGTVTPSGTVENLAAVTTHDGTTLRHCVFYSQSTNVLFGCGMTSAGTMITEKTISTFTAASRLGRITALDGVYNGSTEGQLAVAVDVSLGAVFAAPPNMNIVRIECLSVVKTLLSTATVETLVYNALLSSRLAVIPGARIPRVVVSACRFIVGDATAFLFDLTAAYSGTPTTTSPLMLARLAYGEVAFPAFNNTWDATFRLPAALTKTSSAKVIFPVLRFVSSVQTERSSNVTPVAMCRADCDLLSAAPGGLELQNGLLLWGGCPHWYDGRSVSESGFSHRPVLSGSAHSGGAGHVSAGTYQFYVTYAWEDARGNWHESAPSDLLTVTGVLANETITFSATALNLTWKQNVKLVVYRTEANGSVFYRDQSVANAPGSSTVSISSDGSDAGLLGGSIVPISGDVLENEPLPSCRHMFIWHNRLWMSGCNDGYDLHFSQELAEGFGVEFNSELIRRSSSAFGRVVAVEDQGQRLAIFGEERTGFLYGTGPTRTGDQDNYSEIEPGDTVVGTVWESPRAVLGTPEGIWFPTERGMRLLLDDGNLARAQDGAEVGSEIDALVDAVAPTALIASHCQLRRELWVWAFDKLAAFVWNYEWKQWTEQVPGGDFDGTITDGVDVDGVPTFSENSTGYSIGTLGTTIFDPGSAEAQTTLETPWLQVAGVQGFERVYKMVVIGKLLSSTGVISVEITAAFDFAAFGAADVTANVTSNANGFIQFEHPFATQKCQAMKLRMRITPGANRFRLTNLTFLVGIKKGVVKLPSSQRI